MATPFKQWLKHKFKPHKKQTTSDGNVGQHHDDQDSSPPPPIQITGHDVWPSIPIATPDGVATDYGLFKTLPLELRRQILGHAFGHQILHVDLTFDHPLTHRTKLPVPPKTRRWKFTPTPADLNGRPLRTHAGLESELFRDTSQPKQWQWFSCVCHRRLVRPDEDDGATFRKPRIEPCEDGCIPGDRIGERPRRANTRSESLCFCESTDASASKCFIGAIGWLLACRQAYHDGTSILYTTNTFHIASLPLLDSLPRLLPPHHLSTITSLELLFSFGGDTLFNSTIMASVWANAQPRPSSPSTATEVADRKKTRFHALCEMVPVTFPNVRRLYVALQAYIVPPASFGSENIVGDVERVVLGPVEDMFRVLGGAGQQGTGKEFSLAIQQGGWWVLADRLTGRDPGAERYYEVFGGGEDGSGCWHQQRVWKPLGRDGEGYWLRLGWDDFAAFGVADYWMFNLWGTDHWRGEF